MIGIAVYSALGIAMMHRFCQTISGDAAIRNHLDSRSTELLKIRKEQGLIPAYASAFAYIQRCTYLFCYLVNGLKATKVWCGYIFIFGRCINILCQVSHPTFSVWPRWWGMLSAV